MDHIFSESNIVAFVTERQNDIQYTKFILR